MPVQKKKPAKKKQTKKKPAKKRQTKKKQSLARTERPSRKKAPADVYSPYEKALSLLHQKKYGKARQQFAKLVDAFPSEIEVIARAKIFLRVCDSHLRTQKKGPPSTPEETFNQGVFYHNAGQYDKALEHYTRALKRSKKQQDHIHYAIAATELSMGNTDDALKHLEKAIQINGANRFFAHNDPDFEPLTTDKKFQKLIFPA